MPTYNYCCPQCKITDLLKTDEEFGLRFYQHKDENSPLIWEVKHSIHEKPEVECPLCGAVSSRTFLGVDPVDFRTKGNGYLDTEGCRRDMALYRLTNAGGHEGAGDPYDYLREPGEVDDLADRLRKAGKTGYDKNGRKKTQYYTK